MPGFTRIVNVQDLHLKLIVKMGEYILTKSCQLLYLAKEGFRMEGTLNFDSLDIGANF